MSLVFFYLGVFVVVSTVFYKCHYLLPCLSFFFFYCYTSWEHVLPLYFYTFFYKEHTSLFSYYAFCDIAMYAASLLYSFLFTLIFEHFYFLYLILQYQKHLTFPFTSSIFCLFILTLYLITLLINTSNLFWGINLSLFFFFLSLQFQDT